MVGSDVNIGKVTHERLGFHRDPSFSGWGEKEGVFHRNGVEEREIVNTSEEDENFELPVLRQVGVESDVKMNGGNRNENYASFDIEDGNDRELDSTDTNYVYKSKDVMSTDTIAVSDILKTLFLILMWYIFSTLLTLLETPSVKLLGIILVISVGILLTVAKETAFEIWGFIFVMLAAVMSGFRWSMTQILLQKEVYGLKNPLKLMSYVTPIMAMGTAFFSLILDPWDEFRKTSYFDSSWHITRSGLLMLLGGTLAFFMVLTEYILVSITSAVTVTIAGVVKEAVTILVAVFYFHDEFTWLKGAGLGTIMFAVSLFNWYKYQKFQNRKSSGDDTEESAKKIPAKYVILEDMEDEEINS